MNSNDAKRICLNNSVLEFMGDLLASGDKRVLEFGAGWSTLWFAERAGELLSIETNDVWFNRISSELLGYRHRRCEIRLAKVTDFEFSLTEADGKFDLVLVDGFEPTRFEATTIGWPMLNPGGWLLFDDAQRPKHKDSIDFLKRRAGGEYIALLYGESDVEAARDRVTLAFRKEAE